MSRGPEVGLEARPVWLKHRARKEVAQEEIGELGRVWGPCQSFGSWASVPWEVSKWNDRCSCPLKISTLAAWNRLKRSCLYMYGISRQIHEKSVVMVASGEWIWEIREVGGRLDFSLYMLFCTVCGFSIKKKLNNNFKRKTSPTLKGKNI